MSERVRVLVVDDSAFARSTISKMLNTDPQIEVVGAARDGIEALEQVKSLKPSVVTLDVTMPRMDGLTALGRIMAECPTPVVMLSALTGEQTHAPGARKENLAVFIERLRRLEEIAMKYDGVQKAYAVKAGKELRVIVDVALTRDENAYDLSKEIARSVERELSYPGQIKVSVVRETRAVRFAV